MTAITTKPTTDDYRAGWERVFGKPNCSPIIPAFFAIGPADDPGPLVLDYDWSQIRKFGTDRNWSPRVTSEHYEPIGDEL